MDTEQVKRFPPEQLARFLHEMVLIRKFEEKTNEMYHQGHIGGYCHLYIGEEAVAVGALNVLRNDDYVIGAYRDHGHAILRGSTPRHIMAELFGKRTGVSKGKGGSMHMFNAEKRFLGGDGIVAGELPIAVGLAFAVEYRGGDEIVLCFFGEGAVNEGAFHEALNWASLWNLPVLFLCENNEWGMGTPVAEASCSIDITDRARGLCMRIEQVDGMDVLGVHDAASQAVEYVRTTRKPIFLEAVTQRFAGHSVTDPQVYRTREQVAKARENDPIQKLKKAISDSNIKLPRSFDEIENDADEEVEDAVKFALESEFPPEEDICSDIWDMEQIAEEA